jgi:hypothetical protein
MVDGAAFDTLDEVAMQVSFRRLPSIKFRIVLILMVRTKDSLLSLAVISAAVQRSQQRDHTENKYKDDLQIIR